MTSVSKIFSLFRTILPILMAALFTNFYASAESPEQHGTLAISPPVLTWKELIDTSSRIIIVEVVSSENSKTIKCKVLRDLKSEAHGSTAPIPVETVELSFGLEKP
jgi:hypothetical protein